ncbi:MAG: glycosyltransferase family 2 protein [Propionibacteriaceae bacterium]|nr:glycosyltransferase family 2 protein [Propionibacteriaceae bacterium]
MKPHISVCIPVYQGDLTLSATLRSVLASECDDFEVVVRDNGSTDGTPQVVNQFDDPRIRYVRSETTIPLQENWQAAVEEARGDLIKVVCADDLIHPRCLASQAALLEDPTVGLVACRRDLIDGDGKTLTPGAGLRHLEGRHTAADVAKVTVRYGINPIGEAACVMFRRRDFDAIGGFDHSTMFTMDVDAWLRLLDCGDLIGQSESYAAFRIWTESLSNSHNRTQFDEHMRFLKKVAADPRYGVPAMTRRSAPAVARLSWQAWAMRQWLWQRRR